MQSTAQKFGYIFLMLFFLKQSIMLTKAAFD